MSVQYEEIGKRLRAFRLGSGLSAEEVARRIGISRTAVYRFEKGEVVKIEALTGLAELLNVSLATLLGVEIEYIPSAVTYFERLRQLETEANQIIVLAGPISFLLASDRFHESLELLLKESVPEGADHRNRTLADIDRIVEILHERKRNYLARRPTIVNLMSAHDIVRLLRSGFVGQPFVPPDDLEERRARARHEVKHFIDLIESEPIGHPGRADHRHPAPYQFPDLPHGQFEDPVHQPLPAGRTAQHSPGRGDDHQHDRGHRPARGHRRPDVARGPEGARGGELPARPAGSRGPGKRTPKRRPLIGALLS